MLDRDLTTGETATFDSDKGFFGGRMSLTATVEPDADADGYGDESQDVCVGNAGSSNGCAVENDIATVTEDAGATAISVLSNDSNGQTVSSVTQPESGRGTVQLAGDGTVSYAPTANYCNSQPGGVPATFTYTTSANATGNVAVTVTCVDDPPKATDNEKTVSEDDPATAIDVLGNDTDTEGDAITIASAIRPANGTVVLTGGTAAAHTGLTYRPDAGYCNTEAGGTPDTFTYKLNGGSEATVSVTVTCAADPAAPQNPPTQAGTQRPSSTGPVRDTVAPVITSSELSTAVFEVKTDAAASRVSRGSRLGFTLSEPATVVFVTEQRVGRRWRKIRIFGKRFAAGRNTLDFSGKIKPRGKQRALKPGRYRIRMRPSDRAGNKGVVSTVGFTIAR